MANCEIKNKIDLNVIKKLSEALIKNNDLIIKFSLNKLGLKNISTKIIDELKLKVQNEKDNKKIIDIIINFINPDYNSESKEEKNIIKKDISNKIKFSNIINQILSSNDKTQVINNFIKFKSKFNLDTVSDEDLINILNTKTTFEDIVNSIDQLLNADYYNQQKVLNESPENNTSGDSNDQNLSDEERQNKVQKNNKFINKKNIIEIGYHGNTYAIDLMYRNFIKNIVEMTIYSPRNAILHPNNECINPVFSNELNQNIFRYKIQLYNILVNNNSLKKIVVDFDNISTQEAINKLTEINNYINANITTYQNKSLSDLNSTAEITRLNAFTILLNFDKILKITTDFIEIAPQYDENNYVINKYKYTGANIELFTTWTTKEEVDMSDQISSLAKILLNYFSEIDYNNNKKPNSPIGYYGFFQVATAFITWLKHTNNEDILSEDYFKQEDLEEKLYQVFCEENINALTTLFERFFNLAVENKSNLIKSLPFNMDKLRGIYHILKPDSKLKVAEKNMFWHMMFKIVSNVGKTTSMYNGSMSNKLLQDKFKQIQLYQLNDSIKAAINNLKYKNPDLWQEIQNKYNIELIDNEIHVFTNKPYEFIIKKSTNGYSFSTIYVHKEKVLKNKESYIEKIDKDIKQLIYEILGIELPGNYKEILENIGSSEINSVSLLDVYFGPLSFIFLALLSPEEISVQNLDDETTEDFQVEKYSPSFTNLKTFLDYISASDLPNTLKNSEGNMIAAYSLVSMAHQMQQLVLNTKNKILKFKDKIKEWNKIHKESKHKRNTRRNSYEGNIIYEQYRTAISEPVVRIDVKANQKVKSAKKLTEAEVEYLAIVVDFFNNLYNKESKSVDLQNTNFSDKSTHFNFSFSHNMLIGNQTLAELAKKFIEADTETERNEAKIIFENAIFKMRKQSYLNVGFNLINDFIDVYYELDNKSEFAELKEKLKPHIEILEQASDRINKNIQRNDNQLNPNNLGFTKTEIKALINVFESFKNQKEIKAAFRNAGIDCIEEIHYTKTHNTKFNESLIRDLYKYTMQINVIDDLYQALIQNDDKNFDQDMIDFISNYEAALLNLNNNNDLYKVHMSKCAELSISIIDKYKNLTLSYEDFAKLCFNSEDNYSYRQLYHSNKITEKNLIIYNNDAWFKFELAKQQNNFINDLKDVDFELNVNFDNNILELLNKIGIQWVDEITGEVHLTLNDKEHPEISRINPLLLAYYYSDILLSNATNEILLGKTLYHPNNYYVNPYYEDVENEDYNEDGTFSEKYYEKAMASRIAASLKRTVPAGATVQTFKPMKYGVANETKVACIADLQAYVYNMFGDIQHIDAWDGSGFSSPIQAILEIKSLLDAAVGMDKKTIFADIDPVYGNARLLKWAVFALTNDRRQMSMGSDVSAETLFKKMHNESLGITNYKSFQNYYNAQVDANGHIKSYSYIKLDSTDHIELTERNVIYRYDPSEGKYYLIANMEFNNNQAQWDEYESNNKGEIVNKTAIHKSRIINTLYDLDQIYGGAYASQFNSSTKSLQWSDVNNQILAKIVCDRSLKNKFIGYAVQKSALKTGITNVNEPTCLNRNNNDSLWTFKMSLLHGGVQMNAEHELDHSDVTEMSQMISSLIQGGFFTEDVDAIYEEIGRVVIESLDLDNRLLSQDNYREIHNKLGKDLIESFVKNDRDTLGLAQSYLMKVSEALQNDPDIDINIPFSDPTVKGIFIANLVSLINKRGIRRRYAGLAGYLVPSKGMIQTFLINGNQLMWNDLCKFIKSDPFLNSLFSKFNPDEYLQKKFGTKIENNEKLNEVVPLFKPGNIIFGHPAVGKTYSVENGKYQNLFIDWDTEYNEGRDKWIEEHTNTVKGTIEFKNAQNEYLINSQNYPDYIEYLTAEWNRIKNKAKKENKILIASPSVLLDLFAKDFDLILDIDEGDFINRNISRGSSPENSAKWKEDINNSLLPIHNIPRYKVKTNEYLEDILDAVNTAKTNVPIWENLSQEDQQKLTDEYNANKKLPAPISAYIDDAGIYTEQEDKFGNIVGKFIMQDGNENVFIKPINRYNIDSQQTIIFINENNEMHIKRVETYADMEDLKHNPTWNNCKFFHWTIKPADLRQDDITFEYKDKRYSIYDLDCSRAMLYWNDLLVDDNVTGLKYLDLDEIKKDSFKSYKLSIIEKVLRIKLPETGILLETSSSNHRFYNGTTVKINNIERNIAILNDDSGAKYIFNENEQEKLNDVNTTLTTIYNKLKEIQQNVFYNFKFHETVPQMSIYSEDLKKENFEGSILNKTSRAYLYYGNSANEVSLEESINILQHSDEFEYSTLPLSIKLALRAIKNHDDINQVLVDAYAFTPKNISKHDFIDKVLNLVYLNITNEADRQNYIYKGRQIFGILHQNSWKSNSEVKISNINHRAAECVTGRINTEEFGLREGDSIYEILTQGANFFRNRISNNLKFDLLVNDQINDKFDACIFNKNGKKVFVKLKSNISKTGNEKEINDWKTGHNLKANANYIQVNGVIYHDDEELCESLGIEAYTFNNNKTDYDLLLIDNLDQIDLLTNSKIFDKVLFHYSSTLDEEQTKQLVEKNYSFYNYFNKDGILIKDIKLNNESSNLYIDAYNKETNKLNNIHKEDIYNLMKEKFQGMSQFNNNLFFTNLLNSKERIEHEHRIENISKDLIKAFIKQLEFIGARIPTQSMQSFQSLKIVAFSNSKINEIYVPAVQTWLQGSDYDIDKLYAMLFQVNKNGRIQTFSNLQHINNSKSLDFALKLDMPTNITYSEWNENLDISEDQVINISIKEMKGVSEMTNADPINKILRKKNVKYIRIEQPHNININEYNKIKRKFFYYLNIHNNTKIKGRYAIDSALKNNILGKILGLFDNPINQAFGHNPINMDTLKGLAKLSELGQKELGLSLDNPHFKFLMQVQNMVGKDVIGITAIGMKVFFATSTFVNETISKLVPLLEEYTKNKNEGIKYEINQLFSDITFMINGKLSTIANVNLKPLFDIINAHPELKSLDLDLKLNKNYSAQPTMEELLNELKENSSKLDAAEAISQLLSAATDNAKELILAKINATPDFADAWSYLITCGFTLNEIGDILTSPIFQLVSKYSNISIFDTLIKASNPEMAVKYVLGMNQLSGVNLRDLKIILGQYRKKSFDKKDEPDNECFLDKLIYETYTKNILDRDGNIVHKIGEIKFRDGHAVKRENPIITEDEYNEYMTSQSELRNHIYDLLGNVNIDKNHLNPNAIRHIIEKADIITSLLQDHLLYLIKKRDISSIELTRKNFNTDIEESTLDMYSYSDQLEMEQNEEDLNQMSWNDELSDEELLNYFNNNDFNEDENFKVSDEGLINLYRYIHKYSINRIKSIKNINNYEDELIKLIQFQDEILDGVKEQQIAGVFLRSNQGLKTNDYDFYSELKQIEKYVFKKYLKYVSTHEEIENPEQNFDIIKFIKDDDYRIHWQNIYDSLKSRINILKMIDEVKNFKEMFGLHYMANNYMFHSFTVRLEFLVANYLTQNKNVTLSKEEWIAMSNWIQHSLQANWLFKQGIKFKLPITKSGKVWSYWSKPDNIWILNNNDQSDTPLEIILNDAGAGATFVRLVESYVKQYLKNKYTDNTFVKFLNHGHSKSNVFKQFIYHLKTTINVLGVKKSDKLNNLYNEIEKDFNKIADDKIEEIGGLTIRDIMFIYNTLVYKNTISENGFTKLFQNSYLNFKPEDEKNNLITSYADFQAQLDSLDPKNPDDLMKAPLLTDDLLKKNENGEETTWLNINGIELNLNDLWYKLSFSKDSALKFNIEQIRDKEGTLEGFKYVDMYGRELQDKEPVTFTIPNANDWTLDLPLSFNAVNAPLESIDHVHYKPKIGAISPKTLAQMIIDQLGLNVGEIHWYKQKDINDIFEHGQNEANELKIRSNTEKNRLRNANAFINNGVIWINEDLMELDTTIHELMHVICAVAKFNRDPNIKSQYYIWLNKIYEYYNSNEELKQKLDDFKQKYNLSKASDLKEELLVNHLANIFSLKFAKKYNTKELVQNQTLSDFIKSIISNTFELSEDISDIPANKIGNYGFAQFMDTFRSTIVDVDNNNLLKNSMVLSSQLQTFKRLLIEAKDKNNDNYIEYNC